MIKIEELKYGEYYYSKKLNTVGRWNGSMFITNSGAIIYEYFEPREEANWGTPRIEL